MRSLDKGYVLLETTYVKGVRFALRARWLVLLLAAATVGMGVYNAGQVPLSFTSATDRSEFLAKVELPLGTGLTQAKRVAIHSSVHPSGHPFDHPFIPLSARLYTTLSSVCAAYKIEYYVKRVEE